MKCPCRGCSKRWVSQTSRCHSSCEEYKEWAENNKQLAEKRNKQITHSNSVKDVLFNHLRK